MDKITALEICFDLWLWLACNPNVSYEEEAKEFWPYWKDMGGDVERCENDCPCCEYVSGFGMNPFSGTGLFCEKCPIDWTVSVCYRDGSPYAAWRDSEDTDDRSKYALEIASRALDSLFEELNI